MLPQSLTMVRTTSFRAGVTFLSIWQKKKKEKGETGCCFGVARKPFIILFVPRLSVGETKEHILGSLKRLVFLTGGLFLLFAFRLLETFPRISKWFKDP